MVPTKAMFITAVEDFFPEKIQLFLVIISSTRISNFNTDLKEMQLSSIGSRYNWCVVQEMQSDFNDIARFMAIHDWRI